MQNFYLPAEILQSSNKAHVRAHLERLEQDLSVARVTPSIRNNGYAQYQVQMMEQAVEVLRRKVS